MRGHSNHGTSAGADGSADELAIDRVFGRVFGSVVDGGAASPGSDDPETELEHLLSLRDACRLALGEGSARNEVTSASTAGSTAASTTGSTAGEAVAERASETLRCARVTRRILARTTREDLGRKGDVGLLVDFASERLRDSALLRVAVALLIVQVTVVPLIAWHVLRSPELIGFRMGLEPAVEDFTDQTQVEELLGDVVGGSDAASLEDALGGLDLVEDVARAGSLLRSATRAAGGHVPVGPSSELGRLLAAFDTSTIARSDSDVPVGRSENMASAVVRSELRLQHFAATGEWRGLSEALEDLAAHARAPGATTRGLELTRRAFAHAQALGVATPSLPETVTAPGIAPASVSDAISWLNALASEIQASSPTDPYVAAWIAAVREL